MQASVGAEDVPREDAEATLFGSANTPENDKPTFLARTQADRLQALQGTRRRLEEAQGSAYGPEQLRQGTVLNAAVVVKDDTRIDETAMAIERAGAVAGLPLRAVSWRGAVGVLGSLLSLMEAVLFGSVVIIFLVAMVVMNNALVMAALERVSEIGTLRAIGAQRRFVLGTLVVESVALGACAGTLGALVGAVVVVMLGRFGVPATSDVMTFFFSGPRLFPLITASQVSVAVLAIIGISLVSGIYPALLATRVSPREAMHAKE
jgi:ABC-type lipoprotein release transport system permease subunit